MNPDPLPIDEVLPRLTGALRDGRNVVLTAPPGAGKTTRVPPGILDAGLAGGGRIVVVEPRRIAARAAARRIAEERRWTPGREVGWNVRFERCFGSDTRILFVTEGVLVRRLQEDPFLEGVSVVAFDEFHERNIDADLAIAMCRRVQGDSRRDLRILAMSATLDADPLVRWLDADLVESRGFLHPVTVRHLDRPDARRLPERVRDGVRSALAMPDAAGGDVLVFLPGVGEIRSCGELIAEDARRAGADVVLLYGDLPPERQDQVLARGPRRRVILATNVAETSITVPGVTVVVDSGLQRIQRHDPARGVDSLVLTDISRSSADQRAGRAGRTSPGTCLRLWTKHEERALPDRHEPEIRRVDLAGAALELLAWGERDVAAFPWFEAPAPARVQAALDLLARLGATDGGRVTDVGRAMASIPAAPRIARLLVEGHRLGHVRSCARAAALLAERDPVRPRGGRGRRTAQHASESDLLDRLDALRGDDSPHEMAPGTSQWTERAARQLEDAVRDALGRPPAPAMSEDEAVLRAVLSAFPDRVARRRDQADRRDDRRAVTTLGQGVRLAEESAVETDLFVCLDLDAGAPGDPLVRAASGIHGSWLPAGQVVESVEVTFDDASGRVVAHRRRRFGAIVLDEAAVPVPDDDRTSAFLVAAAAADLSRALDLDHLELAAFRARVAWLRVLLPEAGLPSLDEDHLRSLLPDLCTGCRSFADLRRVPLLDHLRGRLSREHTALLGREAPERITVPSGSEIPLRYEPGKAPVLAVRIQEIFGWADAPRIAGGRVRLVLHLLGPNHQPQQVTDDLRSFWTNMYPDVRKELKRRYPRHAWPEDPWTAQAERRPQRRRRN